MTKTDVFNKKHEDTLAQDKRAVLEEMNLPPAVVSFLRENSKNLKILIAVLFIGLIAWEGYGKYTSVQREKSSVMLYDAMAAELSDQPAQLKALTDKFPQSASAAWAQVELGHMALKDEKFQDAAGFYTSVLDSLSKKSALYPLVQFSLAQAYENLADTSKAKGAYLQLIDIPGFATEGYLGLGRIAESEGDLKQALANYQEYINQPGISPGPTKDWVDSKISQLNGAQ